MPIVSVGENHSAIWGSGNGDKGSKEQAKVLTSTGNCTHFPGYHWEMLWTTPPNYPPAPRMNTGVFMLPLHHQDHSRDEGSLQRVAELRGHGSGEPKTHVGLTAEAPPADTAESGLQGAGAR